MSNETKRILKVDLNNAKDRIADLSNKAGESAKEKAAELGRAALNGIAAGSKLGFRKFVDAGIHLSERQVSAMKRLKISLGK